MRPVSIEYISKFISPTRTLYCRLGVVACSCNPVAWRPGSGDGLRAGALLSDCLCRSGVRTKPGINMGYSGEPGHSRLSKEGRIGPGWKHSRQKFPCRAVVGSRLGTGNCRQPVQYNGTRPFLLHFVSIFFNFYWQHAYFQM